MSTAAAQAIGNRTGIQTSPDMAEEAIEAARSADPSSAGNGQDLAEFRGEYIEEGFTIGSLPMMPASDEAEAKPQQAGLAVLLDKLSERLAFERSGTRLYEALLNKCEILGEGPPGPTLEDIRHIGSEELKHFALISRVIEEIGGDPTEESPCADVSGVASMGLIQVLTDPRTSMAQCLQAMLTAELTDNAGWELLINLAAEMGYQEMAGEFRNALESEQEHLEDVRVWLSECVMEQAQV